MRRFLLILLLLYNSELFAQEYTIEHYGQQEGLKTTTIFTVFQDSKGYLWLGTSLGAARFDGKDFEYFDKSNGLIGYSVYQIYEDSKNRIWFLTEDGEACFFHKEKIFNSENTPFLAELKQNDSFLYGFHERENGDIYIGSFNRGYKVLHPDHSVSNSHQLKLSPSNNRVIDFFPYVGALVIYPSTTSFVCVDLANQKLIWEENVFENSTFIRAERLNNKEIIAFSKNEGVIFDIAQRKIVKKWTIDPISEIIFLKKLEDNTVLAGSRDGLFEIKNGEFKPHKLNQILTETAISGFIKDRAGHLWISTLNKGLFKIGDYAIKRDARFQTINEPIYSLNSLGNDSLFIGTQKKYYFLFNGQEIDSVAVKQDGTKFKKTIVVGKDSLFIFSENELIFQTNQTIIQRAMAIKGINFNKATQEFYFSHINGVTHLSKKEIINMLYETEDEIFRNRLKDNVGSERYANGAAFDYKRGYDYVITKKGLQKCKNGNCEYLKLKNLPDNIYMLRMVQLDSSRIAIATLGTGLLYYHFAQGIEKVLTEKDGLADIYILDVYKDDYGDVWIKHPKGVSSVSQQYEIKNFGKSDGLGEETINTVGFYKGDVLFGTNSGILVSEKSRLLDKTYQDETIDFRFLKTKKGEQYINSNEIVVPANEEFTLFFNLLSFYLGDNIGYFYRLDKGQWIPSSSELISFNNLSQGKHLLEIFAQNDQRAKSKIYSLSIESRQAWYKSSFAIIGYLCLLGFFIYLLFHSKVLKFNYEEFVETLYKIKNIKSTVLQEKPIVIKATDGSNVKVDIKTIEYIAASGNYCEIFTSKGKIVTRSTLKRIENLLESHKSIKRIHRSFLVNSSKVSSYDKTHVKINQTKIPIGKNYSVT